MITYDHRGRPLSPAMSELLSSTVIPCPKNSRKQRKSSSAGEKSKRLESFPSSCSLSSSSSISTANLSNGPITPPNINNLTDNPAGSGLVVFEGDDVDNDEGNKTGETKSSRQYYRRRQPQQHRKTNSGSSTIRRNYANSVSSSSSTSSNSSSSSSINGDGDDEDDGANLDDDVENEIPDEDELFNWSWIDDFKSNSRNRGPSWSEDFDWSSDYSSGPRKRSRSRKLELPLEECTTDHPLSSGEEDNDDEDDDEENDNAEDDKKSGAKGFVNNITASLKAVANTLSSQEKLYSSQLFAFSPRSTDEPIPSRVGGGGFGRGSIHLHEPASPLPPSTVRRDQKPQQQEKQKSTISTTSATGPNGSTTNAPTKKKSINLKTYAVETTLIPHLRPREIRMNSAFYRIYAVETLMRKNGKLNPDFQGRATMILEPRSDIAITKEDDEEEIFGIRKRFEDRRNDCRWSVVNASDMDGDDDHDNDQVQS